MNRRALKAKDYCLFWSSSKCCKGFSKINDNVNSLVQKWIIFHPRVIPSPIENYYITGKFDTINGGVNTELSNKFLLRVSVHEVHIEMQKNVTGFSMAYNDNGNFHIIYSVLQFILLPQSLKMTQCHQIMCSCKIYIQDVTYQYYLNPWSKCQLRYIKNQDEGHSSRVKQHQWASSSARGHVTEGRPSYPGPLATGDQQCSGHACREHWCPDVPGKSCGEVPPRGG